MRSQHRMRWLGRRRTLIHAEVARWRRRRPPRRRRWRRRTLGRRKVLVVEEVVVVVVVWHKQAAEEAMLRSLCRLELVEPTLILSHC